MRLTAMIVAAAAISAVSAAWAQPTVYYLFEQKGTENRVCEPQAPDESWVRVKKSGSFEDPGCTIPMDVGDVEE